MAAADGLEVRQRPSGRSPIRTNRESAASYHATLALEQEAVRAVRGGSLPCHGRKRPPPVKEGATAASRGFPAWWEG